MTPDVKIFIRGLESDLTYNVIKDKKLFLYWKMANDPFMRFTREGGEWVLESTGNRFRTLKGAILYGQRWAKLHL